MLHPEWQQDPRFSSAEARLANAEALGVLIAEAIGALNLEEFRERMDARSLTYGFAAQNRELVGDPQLVENDMLVPTAEPEGPYTRTVSNPLQMSDETQRVPSRAPDIGEHSVEILGELGCTADEIDGWLARGVVAQR